MASQCAPGTAGGIRVSYRLQPTQVVSAIAFRGDLGLAAGEHALVGDEAGVAPGFDGAEDHLQGEPVGPEADDATDDGHEPPLVTQFSRRGAVCPDIGGDADAHVAFGSAHCRQPGGEGCRAPSDQVVTEDRNC